MSDTPRTDDCEKSHAHYIYPVQYDAMRDHAKTLERELAAATDDRKRAMRMAFELTQDCQTAEEAVAALVNLVKQARKLRDASAEQAEEMRKDRDAFQRLYREATARAESAERDALMRAAEVCEAIANSPQSTAEKILIATDIKHAILALIQKERT